MGSNRDNFTKKTIEILAKRVGFLCSNPNCRNSTVGANADYDKATNIGIAAHITAASILGPRYDNSITKEQRSHITNGIWLCSNCATLIDKDLKNFSPDIIRKWKDLAEEESTDRLLGRIIHTLVGSPFLEADLIWISSSRFNQGFSNKNPIEIREGKPVMIFNQKPIIHWCLNWNFNFIIYNNSNYPAFNIKIESIGSENFKNLVTLTKTNNLGPLRNIDLKAEYEYFIEGDHTVADNIRKSKYPEKFKNLTLKLTYSDEARKDHITYVEFADNECKNRKG